MKVANNVARVQSSPFDYASVRRFSRCKQIPEFKSHLENLLEYVSSQQYRAIQRKSCSSIECGQSLRRQKLREFLGVTTIQLSTH